MTCPSQALGEPGTSPPVQGRSPLVRTRLKPSHANKGDGLPCRTENKGDAVRHGRGVSQRTREMLYGTREMPHREQGRCCAHGRGESDVPTRSEKALPCRAVT